MDGSRPVGTYMLPQVAWRVRVDGNSPRPAFSQRPTTSCFLIPFPKWGCNGQFTCSPPLHRQGSSTQDPSFRRVPAHGRPKQRQEHSLSLVQTRYIHIYIHTLHIVHTYLSHIPPGQKAWSFLPMPGPAPHAALANHENLAFMPVQKMCARAAVLAGGNKSRTHQSDSDVVGSWPLRPIDAR